MSVATQEVSPTTAPRRVLLREVQFVRLDLVESDDKSGKVILRGEFARCGVPTQNRRVYGESLWDREIRRLNSHMKGRRLFGEMDHPADGRTELKRVSHVITGLRIENGKVIGEAEILPTPQGQTLVALLRAGCPVGVSSRGYGSIKKNQNGEDVVQEDYRLATFDVVADPADSEAWPEAMFEGKKAIFEGKEIDSMEADAIKEGAETDPALQKKFSKEILENLAAVRAEVTEQVRGELLSDPAVAGAKSALDRIRDVLRPFGLTEDVTSALQQKDVEIQRLQAQLADSQLKVKQLGENNQKLVDAAKEAGFLYFLESKLGSDPHAPLLRKLIGDVRSYADTDEIEAKILAIREDLQVQEQRQLQERAERQTEQQRLVESERQMTSRLDQMQQVLEHSLEVNKELGIRLYAAERLRNHPKAEKISQMIEASKPTTVEAVDALIEQYRAPKIELQDYESVRSRVRERMGSGKGFEPSAMDEDISPQRKQQQREQRQGGGQFNGLPVSVADLARLAGIDAK